MSKRFYIYFFIAGFVIALSGCKTSEYANVNTGDMAVYQPGLPNFTMGAYSVINSNETTGLNVYLDIPYNSLIFKSNQEKNNFDSKIRIVIQITRTDTQPAQQHSQSFSREIIVPKYQETQSLKKYHFQYKILAHPGNYRVEAVVSDQHTQKYVQHVVVCTIPDIKKESIATGSLSLLGKGNSKKNPKNANFHPEVNYNLTQSVDSLKASIQLYLKSSDNNSKLVMQLYRFRTDTLPAKPPFYISPSHGSLGYIGIQYNKRDTIQTVDRQLNGLKGAVSVDFILPHLKAGTYRVKITGEKKDSTIFYKARDFSIKGIGFPDIRTIYEMADAMCYITYPKEYKKLMSHHSADSLKMAFDALWGKLIPNKSKAQSVINTYYSRVVQANKLFSNYKEGWKTDPGMIYIVYGPPDYTEQNIDGMTWYYSSISNNTMAFYFRKIIEYSRYFPFNHYILIRNIGYQQSYISQIEDWRTGYIR